MHLIIYIYVHIFDIYGPGLQAPPHPPPQRVWVHRGLYVQGGLVCYKWSSPRPPPVGWGGVSVCTCIMYLYVSMYVCIYSMPRPPPVWGGRVCMYMHVWVYVCISL